MPGTCLAQSAPLSTGHRLHRGRSRSVRVGKWCPYALALLPPSTLCRRPACRRHNHLYFPSTVGSSPSRLSALTPCFLLQSTLKSLVDLNNFYLCQERFSATPVLDVFSNAMSWLSRSFCTHPGWLFGGASGREASQVYACADKWFTTSVLCRDGGMLR